MELSTLRRSTTEAKVAGVCVALADRWRIDPLLVRLVAVVLALSGGVGLVLYAAAWLAVPAHGSDRAAIDSVLPGVRHLPRPVWIVGLVALSLLSVVALASVLPFGIGPALVLGGICYVGLLRSGRLASGTSAQGTETETRPIPPAPFTESTRFTEAAAAWQQRMQQHLYRAEPPTQDSPAPADPGYSLQAFLAHPDPVGLYEPPAPSEPAEPAAGRGARRHLRPDRTQRRLARWRSIALVLLPLAAVAISDVWLGVPSYAYPAGVLLGIGVALLIGTWRPRPRGLIALGLVLSVAALGSATAHRVDTGLPETNIRYLAAADFPADGTHADVGTLVLDLSDLALDQDLRHQVNVDAGRLVIVPPPDTTVRLEWSVDMGSAYLQDTRREGVDLNGVLVQQGPPGAPTLTLQAKVDVGELVMDR